MTEETDKCSLGLRSSGPAGQSPSADSSSEDCLKVSGEPGCQPSPMPSPCTSATRACRNAPRACGHQPRGQKPRRCWLTALTGLYFSRSRLHHRPKSKQELCTEILNTQVFRTASSRNHLRALQGANHDTPHKDTQDSHRKSHFQRILNDTGKCSE